jgi:tetratricopeptide (TPR) repeat protein
MRNFSIIQNSSQSVLEQYTDFLSKEVYYDMQSYDINNPLFLQQLGVLQAEGIRKAINTNSAVTYAGFQRTNENMVDFANFIGDKIGSTANMLSSSLDRGFGTLNNSLISIDSGINTVNKNLIALENTTVQGFSALNNNLFALRNMVGQCFSTLYTQLRLSNHLLNDVLTELKIPETQRERRYHVEEGAKYLSNALVKGGKLYFEDAFDEFSQAIAIERKDFFSWFNLGIIYLRSKEHIDISKAIDAFERFGHYAQAEVMHKKNQNLEYQIDEAYLYLAEAHYLQKKLADAISETERCTILKAKADFMKVKYLSATNDKTNKQKAADILSKLINKEPYISLQVKLDNDIDENEFVTDLLEELRKGTVEKANSLCLKIEESLKNDYHIRQTEEKISKIRSLLQTQMFLDSYEAIILMKKNYEWKSQNGALFNSTLLDFESKEKEAFGNAGGISLFIKTADELQCSGRYEDAIEYYNSSIRLNLKYNTYYIYCYEGKAFCLMFLEKYEEAIECYDALIKLYIEKDYFYEYKLNCYEYKADCLKKLNRYEEAIECYDTAIELITREYQYLYKDRLIYYEYKAYCLILLEKDKDAIKCYDTVIKLYNGYYDKEVERNRTKSDVIKTVNHLMFLEKYEEAILYYDVLIKFFTEKDYYKCKADCLISLGKYEEAIKCYDGLIKKYNDSWDVAKGYEYKADCLISLGKYEDAIKCYDALIKLYPKSSDYRNLKKELLKKTGKHWTWFG